MSYIKSAFVPQILGRPPRSGLEIYGLVEPHPLNFKETVVLKQSQVKAGRVMGSAPPPKLNTLGPVPTGCA